MEDMNQSQKYPKLMIVSNGKRTAALLDGAFLGKQIPKMEFVADGNDVEQVSAAVKQAKANRATGRPTMVILNTLKGCGVKWIEEMGAGNHNTNVSEEQAKAAIAEIREG